jgi:hypothetical protein
VPGEGSNERVAHVLAGENSGDRDPGWGRRRQVLNQVDCRVNRADKERGFDFFGEEALAARLGERSVLDNVAAGADDLKRGPLYLTSREPRPEGGAPHSLAPAPTPIGPCRG